MIQQLTPATDIPDVPANINNAISFHEDVIYGPGDRDRLDLYRPKKAQGSTPCLVFIHGGSFVSGDKGAIRRPTYQSFITALLGKGISVLSVNYELTQTPFDPQGIGRAMRGIAKALLEVKRGANILEIDPENCIYMGSSAGGFASQWFALKEFSTIEGISLLPKAAISFKPNLTMSAFRIEELGLLGEGVTLDDALMDQKFSERCVSWFALEKPFAEGGDYPTKREDLNQKSSIRIQWTLDPIANNMFTEEARPTLLISNDPLEDPDELVEYIHNPANVQEWIDRCIAVGAPIFAIGLDPNNPTPNYPENNPPELISWAIDQFEA